VVYHILRGHQRAALLMKGTNNWAEVRALFILLAVYGLGQITNKTGRRSAKERQLGDMQIFGDSRLLMEWTRGGYNNQNPQLQDATRTANEKAALPSCSFRMQ